MILVKSDRTNQKRCRIHKFELVTEFEPEEVLLVDDSNIPANKLYSMCDEHIERLNKKLEKCRLIQRAIECASNNNLPKQYPDKMYPHKRGRVKGYMVDYNISENGIFIH